MNTLRLLLPALSVLLLVLIQPATARAESVPATVAYVDGDAFYVNGAGQKQKITEHMLIPVGSAITTGHDGTVGLKLVPGATTVVSTDTNVKISSLDYTKTASGEKKRSILLGLTKGTVFSSLAKNDGASDFRVSTPEGVAAARGTNWSVTVEVFAGGPIVTVAVLDGVVVITLPNGGKIRVKGNQIAVSTVAQGANVTYIITDLDPHQRDKIIDGIKGAGFYLSAEDGVSQGSVYSNQPPPDVINPANETIAPTQSPNQ